MKRIIIVINVVFCSQFIVAQDMNNYHFFIHVVDSLKTKYSVNQFINRPMVDLPYQYRQHYSELSEEEQNKVLDYVCEFYNQTNYLGLYGIAGVFLDEYYIYSKESVRRRMIEINFDKISYMSSTVVNFGASKDYTQHAKDRLLEIIEKKWNDDDIKAWTIRIKQTLDIENYKVDVKKIIQETNRQGENIENHLLDSLIRENIEKELQVNMNRPIDKRCIMMIGSLKDNRFIPNLENFLNEYHKNVDYYAIKEACTYALAKLGVQQYIDTVLIDNDRIHCWYLGGKWAYLRWLEGNFVWNKLGRLSTNSMYELPLAMISLFQTQNIIESIPQEIKLGPLDIERFDNSVISEKYNPLKDDNITNQPIIQKVYKLYQWIKDNPDKWEMPETDDYFTNLNTIFE
jgi:hypothetical protein